MNDSFFADVMVVDYGSSYSKIGYAGDDAPYLFPTIIGRIQQQKSLSIERTEYIGDEALVFENILDIYSPVQNGLVNCWEYMEKIINNSFYIELRRCPEDYWLLMIENPLLSTQREKMAEVLYESIEIPCVTFQDESPLSLFCSGKYDGIVVESGHDVTYSAPIFNGKVIKNAVMHMKCSGSTITNKLRSDLTEEISNYSKKQQREIIDCIKETLCYVNSNNVNHLNSNEETTNTYTLPDGKIIPISKELLHCPEVMFNPSLEGKEDIGISEVVFNSIQMVSKEKQKHLYSNIEMAGGNTLFTGFNKRLFNEITELAPPNTKVNVPLRDDRRFSSWIGGSIVGSLSSCQQLFVSKEDYNEYGVSVLNKNWKD